MTGGGGYSVDMERVPQAIVDLRRAADGLRIESENAWNLARITPTWSGYGERECGAGLC